MIRLYHIGKSYGDRDALRDVSLHVQKGEMVYVTGPSGAGKSTMLKLLYGAERPSTGKMLIAGTDVSKLDSRQLPALRRNLGVVFQDFKLLPQRTVAENVGMALEVIGAEPDSIRRRVPAVLNIVGLKGREDDKAGVLSGGEKQRVAIARAIVNDPAILLADEPTGNLDSRTGEEIMALFEDLYEQGHTIIVVTHEEDIARHARRVVRLRDGLIESDGPVP